VLWAVAQTYPIRVSKPISIRSFRIRLEPYPRHIQGVSVSETCRIRDTAPSRSIRVTEVPTSIGANLASACGTPSVQVLSSRTIFLRNFHDHRNRFLPGMIDFAIRLMWLQITDVFMVHSLHFCKKLALLAYN